ncbi:hypothetical protein THAOC_26394 [Thalassiosira oceanica]|uniref:Uncharacterized protein n=1 Tax=Thalassiosira oceanica TaxID=159749 RepID=K0RP41_THAOC|nr:hypothetical protein THAOC_26394 [Thalassiosira oceanica]|mmetsp:Transcript_32717/g.78122  ORF Transcript_32717/g.78122 Transcript_32717/m.78122 type:complete len:83 (-) Transcript_32717:119-367(-)|eukprot:EJK54054.1 hypothetical protein THAOC_26394 [Thalassiosira oceanica]
MAPSHFDPELKPNRFQEETVFDPFRHYCEMTGASLVIVPERFGLTPPQLNSNDIESEADDDWTEEEDDSRDFDNGEDMDAWG